MVNCGPVAPWTCPNEVGCPHDIVQHRFEPDRDRWVCTVDVCLENPYRVVRVSDLSSRSLTMAGYADRMALLRAAHGPEVTFEFDDEPPSDQSWLELTESRRERRRRLGLHWWQRGGQ